MYTVRIRNGETMPETIIKQVQSLRGLPVFTDYAAESDLPIFRNLNLIYGFNGCGKTTLSRVFACLRNGSRHHEWPNDCDYLVTMTDDSVISPNSGSTDLSERILVFNDDFITENLRWQEGEASPIFLLLGEGAKELSESLKAKEKQRSGIHGKVQKATTRFKSAEREFNKHKRDRALLIETGIGKTRGYNARSLENDYANYEYESTDILSEKDLKTQQDILKQDKPLPKCNSVPAMSQSLKTLLRDTRQLITNTLGTVSIETLRDHAAMLPWVKTGLEYHTEQDLKSCLFCGNELTEERTSDLESAIDDRYDTLINDVATAKQRAEELTSALIALKSSLPSQNDIVPEQRTAFMDSVAALKKTIDAGVMQSKAAAELLERKSKTPNTAITPDGLASDDTASLWETKFNDCLTAINKVIAAHNKAHDDFQENRDAAKEKIKKHYLADGHEEYRRLERRVARSKNVKERREKQLNALDSDIDDIKQQMRQHGPAAEQVNAMIQRYLGHNELALAAKDEGYEIRRNGRVATAPPSEGEKTAIALCYFLVLLEGDGRSREDLIVVLDDPISSMDTRSMNYACSMIQSLHNVGQLIVMTHNLNVMNEMKKWLKNLTEKVMQRSNRDANDAMAALFFIDTVQPNGRESRQSRLVEMPKHLRDYEAEYHFLFNMMLRFRASEPDRANYFFVMPNVLRKILEVFLAFKLPGPDGLSSKIKNIEGRADEIGIDCDRLRAVERLAHVESHGDSLDDLVTMSSITVEETSDAANALLELMEKMDKEHKARMCRLCRA
jgi:wobble nucleotide-excising tRNase